MKIEIECFGEYKKEHANDLAGQIVKAGIPEIEQLDLDRETSKGGEMTILGDLTGSFTIILKSINEPLNKLIDCLIRWVEMNGEREIELKYKGRYLRMKGKKIDKNTMKIIEAFFTDN